MITLRDIMREEDEEKSKAAAVVKVEAIKAWDIPQDIVRDILLRLPAKSLMRFKAVRKSWRSLISNPQFVKSHLNLANDLASKGQSGNLQSYGVLRLIKNCDPSNGIRSESVRFSSINSGDTKHEDVNLDYLFEKRSIHHIEILGSCNGLLLIASLYYYFLWNPSTGEYQELPPCNHPDNSTCISGLGYHSSLDEYKAVFAAHVTSPPGSPGRNGYMYEGFHVYLLKSGYSKWKQIWFEDYGLYFSIYSSESPGLTLNGAPHWVVLPVEEDYHSSIRMIIYFDMAEEKFKKVPKPDFMENTKFDLAILAGCLCTVSNENGSHVAIWAMKEYGVKESWTKLFVIELRNLMPLGFMKNGNELVMEIDKRKLVFYNLKTKMEKIIMLIPKTYGFKVAAYVESLISPNVLHWKKIGNI